MLFYEIRSILLDDKYTAHLEESYLYSYSSNAIIGLIIEWYRRDFQESADEMNIHLVNILKLY